MGNVANSKASFCPEPMASTLKLPRLCFLGSILESAEKAREEAETAISHLIEKLERIETEYAQKWMAYKKCRGEKRKAIFRELIELKEGWRAVKRELHHRLKPLILERDGYKCRVCGATEDLELARLFQDSLALLTRSKEEQEFFKYSSPYRTVWERYSPDNMFILCKKCHRRFDSFIGRAWRLGKNAIATVEEAVKILSDEDSFHHPPVFEEMAEKHRRYWGFGEVLTLLKVLRESILFRKHEDFREFRFFLGLVRRELRYFRERLPSDIVSGVENVLKNAERASVAELEDMESNVRAAALAYLKSFLAPEGFNEFVERLAKQDSRVERKILRLVTERRS
jgi:5-methylcytosine-specific restriction endonuclease McrA